jgi:hypothetical protein
VGKQPLQALRRRMPADVSSARSLPSSSAFRSAVSLRQAIRQFCIAVPIPHGIGRLILDILFPWALGRWRNG